MKRFRYAVREKVLDKGEMMGRDECRLEIWRRQWSYWVICCPRPARNILPCDI